MLIISFLIHAFLLISFVKSQTIRFRNESQIIETIDFSFEWIFKNQNQGEFPKHLTGQDLFDIYSGSSGVLIFLLEYSKFKTDARIMELSKMIGDNLIKNFDSIKKFSYYFWHEAKGGVSFSLHNLFLITKEKKYFQIAQNIDDEIISQFLKEQVNSIRRGSSGLGFYLIWLLEHQIYKEDRLRENNVKEALFKAANGIAQNGIEIDSSKMKWYYEKKSGKEYPNYSYGTVGVMHFFSKYYQFSKNQSYYNYAVKGANYVASIANLTDSSGCTIRYQNPPNEEVNVYFGECHGNSGSGKAFLSIYNMTKEKQWLDLAERSAYSLIKYTQKDFNFWIAQSPKKTFFWDNLSICDGNMAAIEFLQILLKFSPKKIYEDEIKNYAENAIKRRIIDGNKNYWKVAEWRVAPQSLSSQVGLYIGASGVSHGLMLINNPKLRIALPDYTFQI